MVSKQNLRQIAGSGGPVPPPAARPGWGANPLHALWRLSPGRLAMYLDQLGELLNAGVTMYEAMGELAAHAHDGRLRRMSREIAMAASRGESFEAQLALYPQHVPPQVRGMLLVGERSGSLPRVCREMAEELRQQQAMHWKYAIGKLYFGALLVVALLVPGLTRIIRPEGPNWQAYIDYANTVVVPVLVGTIVVWFGVKLLAAVPALAEPVQRLLFILPGARQLILRSAMVRFTVSLDALLTAGVDLPEALGLAAGCTGNIVIARQLEQAGRRVRDGVGLEQALLAAPLVPREIRESLLIAERARPPTVGPSAPCPRTGVSSAPAPCCSAASAPTGQCCSSRPSSSSGWSTRGTSAISTRSSGLPMSSESVGEGRKTLPWPCARALQSPIPSRRDRHSLYWVGVWRPLPHIHQGSTDRLP